MINTLENILKPNKKHESSEGEAFLEDYFRGEGITFEAEKPIVGLRNDSKTYRKADFYLPKLDIYVEFLGMWNNTKEDRERYREKKEVYFMNSIPCIYIYPENLGIIEFTFPRRAMQALKKHQKNKELLRYKLSNLWLHKRESAVYFSIALAILIFGTFTWEEDYGVIVFFIVVMFYQVYNITDWYRRNLIL
tara:strand:+ start:543 stop:1118 length:576 start_codon:yes stop_codon:yes gene_type:complete